MLQISQIDTMFLTSLKSSLNSDDGTFKEQDDGEGFDDEEEDQDAEMGDNDDEDEQGNFDEDEEGEEEGEEGDFGKSMKKDLFEEQDFSDNEEGDFSLLLLFPFHGPTHCGFLFQDFPLTKRPKRR